MQKLFLVSVLLLLLYASVFCSHDRQFEKGGPSFSTPGPQPTARLREKLHAMTGRIKGLRETKPVDPPASLRNEALPKETKQSDPEAKWQVPSTKAVLEGYEPPQASSSRVHSLEALQRAVRKRALHREDEASASSVVNAASPQTVRSCASLDLNEAPLNNSKKTLDPCISGNADDCRHPSEQPGQLDSPIDAKKEDRSLSDRNELSPLFSSIRRKELLPFRNDNIAEIRLRNSSDRQSTIDLLKEETNSRDVDALYVEEGALWTAVPRHGLESEVEASTAGLSTAMEQLTSLQRVSGLGKAMKSSLDDALSLSDGTAQRTENEGSTPRPESINDWTAIDRSSSAKGSECSIACDCRQTIGWGSMRSLLSYVVSDVTVGDPTSVEAVVVRCEDSFVDVLARHAISLVADRLWECEEDACDLEDVYNFVRNRSRTEVVVVCPEMLCLSEGVIWGAERVYTPQSSICKAAVHSRLLNKEHSERKVVVSFGPPLSTYKEQWSNDLLSGSVAGATYPYSLFVSPSSFLERSECSTQDIVTVIDAVNSKTTIAVVPDVTMRRTFTCQWTVRSEDEPFVLQMDYAKLPSSERLVVIYEGSTLASLSNTSFDTSSQYVSSISSNQIAIGPGTTVIKYFTEGPLSSRNERGLGISFSFFPSNASSCSGDRVVFLNASNSANYIDLTNSSLVPCSITWRTPFRLDPITISVAGATADRVSLYSDYSVDKCSNSVCHGRGEIRALFSSFGNETSIDVRLTARNSPCDEVGPFDVFGKEGIVDVSSARLLNGECRIRMFRSSSLLFLEVSGGRLLEDDIVSVIDGSSVIKTLDRNADERVTLEIASSTSSVIEVVLKLGEESPGLALRYWQMKQCVDEFLSTDRVGIVSLRPWSELHANTPPPSYPFECTWRVSPFSASVTGEQSFVMQVTKAILNEGDSVTIREGSGAFGKRLAHITGGNTGALQTLSHFSENVFIEMKVATPDFAASIAYTAAFCESDDDVLNMPFQKDIIEFKVRANASSISRQTMICRWLLEQTTSDSVTWFELSKLQLELDDELSIVHASSYEVLYSFGGRTSHSQLSALPTVLQDDLGGWPDQVVVTGGPVFLEFRSSSQLQKASSFALRYEIGRSCQGLKIVEARKATVTDGSASREALMRPGYDMTCSWLLASPKNCEGNGCGRTAINFEYISMDTDASAETTAIELYDGPDLASPLLFRSVKNSLPSLLYASSRFLFMRLTTDNGANAATVDQNRGFAMSFVRDFCVDADETMTLFASTGTVDVSVLRPSRVCEWRITGQRSIAVSIESRETSSVGGSSDDMTLTLLSDAGDEVNVPLAVSGLSYVASGTSFVFRATTSSSFQYTNASVHLSYVVDSTCRSKTLITSFAGTVREQEDEDAHVSASMNCRWIFDFSSVIDSRARGRFIIRTACSSDGSVAIHDGSNLIAPSLISVDSCDQSSLPRRTVTSGPSATVWLTSGSSGGGLGFEIDYLFGFCDWVDGEVFVSSQETEFSSSDLPFGERTYRSGAVCSWIIEGDPSVEETTFSFIFKNKDIDAASYDVLEFYKETEEPFSFESSPSAIVSGSAADAPFVQVVSSRVRVIFRTDSNGVGLGFRAKIVRNACVGTNVLPMSSGRISDGTPEAFVQTTNSSHECSWVLHPLDTAPAIRVFPLYFELGRYASVKIDYVDGSGSFRSVLWDSDTTLGSSVFFPSSTLKIFYSPKQGDRGFSLGYCSTADPSVETIRPSQGKTIGGYSLTVVGNGFCSFESYKVFVEDEPCIQVEVVSSTSLTCSAPPGREPGGALVSIYRKVSASEDLLISEKPFLYETPRIIQVQACAMTGTDIVSCSVDSAKTVIVVGENFGSLAARPTVRIGGRACSPVITSLSDEDGQDVNSPHTIIRCEVEPSFGVKLPIVVRVNGFSSSETDATLSWTLPSITTLNVKEALPWADYAVSIEGTGFLPSFPYSVTFGNTSCLLTAKLHDELRCTLSLRIPFHAQSSAHSLQLSLNGVKITRFLNVEVPKVHSVEPRLVFAGHASTIFVSGEFYADHLQSTIQLDALFTFSSRATVITCIQQETSFACPLAITKQQFDDVFPSEPSSAIGHVQFELKSSGYSMTFDEVEVTIASTGEIAIEPEILTITSGVVSGVSVATTQGSRLPEQPGSVMLLSAPSLQSPIALPCTYKNGSGSYVCSGASDLRNGTEAMAQFLLAGNVALGSRSVVVVAPMDGLRVQPDALPANTSGLTFEVCSDVLLHEKIPASSIHCCFSSTLLENTVSLASCDFVSPAYVSPENSYCVVCHGVQPVPLDVNGLATPEEGEKAFSSLLYYGVSVDKGETVVAGGSLTVYSARPSVERIVPSLAPNTGSSAFISIFGSGFVQTQSLVCAFGSSLRTPAVFYDKLGVLICVLDNIPQAQVGQTEVDVLLDGRTRSLATEQRLPFAFHSPIAVTSVFPARIEAGYGGTITAKGIHFQFGEDLACRFGGSDSLVVEAQFISPREVRCPIVAGLEGEVDLAVANNRQDFSSGKSIVFEGCQLGTEFNESLLSCQNCRPGSFQNGSGTCLPCPAGFFSGERAASCTPCSPGRYSATEGSQTCQICDQFSYAPGIASTTCTSCNRGQSITLQSFLGATSVTDCTCTQGFYQGSEYDEPGDACSPCPLNAVCPRCERDSATCLPVPLFGYWAPRAAEAKGSGSTQTGRASRRLLRAGDAPQTTVEEWNENTVTVGDGEAMKVSFVLDPLKLFVANSSEAAIKCNSLGVFVHNRTASSSEYMYPCDPIDACVGNFSCREGHCGVLCFYCQVGYYKTEGYCEKCPDSLSAAIPTFVAFGAIIVIAVILLLIPKTRRLLSHLQACATVGILIEYYQEARLFEDYKNIFPRLSTPSLVIETSSFIPLSIFTDYQVLSCVGVQLSYESVLLATVMLVVLAVVFVFVVSFMGACHAARQQKKRRYLAPSTPASPQSNDGLPPSLSTELVMAPRSFAAQLRKRLVEKEYRPDIYGEFVAILDILLQVGVVLSATYLQRYPALRLYVMMLSLVALVVLFLGVKPLRSEEFVPTQAYRRKRNSGTYHRKRCCARFLCFSRTLPKTVGSKEMQESSYLFRLTSFGRLCNNMNHLKAAGHAHLFLLAMAANVWSITLIDGYMDEQQVSMTQSVISVLVAVSFGAFGLFAFLTFLLDVCNKKPDEENANKSPRTVLRAGVITLFAFSRKFLMIILQNILSVFDCTTHGDGTVTFDYAPDLPCDDASLTGARLIAIASTAVVVVLLLSAYFVSLKAKKRSPSKLEIGDRSIDRELRPIHTEYFDSIRSSRKQLRIAPEDEAENPPVVQEYGA